MADPLQRLLAAMLDLEAAITRLVDQLEEDYEDLADIFDDEPDQ